MMIMKKFLVCFFCFSLYADLQRVSLVPFIRNGELESIFNFVCNGGIPTQFEIELSDRILIDSHRSVQRGSEQLRTLHQLVIGSIGQAATVIHGERMIDILINIFLHHPRLTRRDPTQLLNKYFGPPGFTFRVLREEVDYICALHDARQFLSH